MEEELILPSLATLELTVNIFDNLDNGLFISVRIKVCIYWFSGTTVVREGRSECEED